MINHHPIFTIFLKYKCRDSSLISTIFRDYSLENVEKFKLSMSKVDWFSLLGGSMYPDVLVDIFNGTINEIFNLSFLIKTKKLSKKRINIPWLSSALLKSMKYKHYHFKLLKRNLINKNQYKIYCKILKKIIEKIKILHYKILFEKYTQN